MKERLTTLWVRGGIAAAVLAIVGTAAASAHAESQAVVASDGTLYEVFRSRNDQLFPESAGSVTAYDPVLALRTTRSGQPPTVEVVAGTQDAFLEASETLLYDESSGTVFIAFAKYEGFQSDIRIAVKRDGQWVSREIPHTSGFCVSLNPKAVVTRQRYTLQDEAGSPIEKRRSIFAITWWENGAQRQARYAAAFVEDGRLDIDSIVPYNLNEFTGDPSPTFVDGRYPSNFQFPAIQRDPTTNGGMFVSYANLVTQRQELLQITFSTEVASTSGTTGTGGGTGLHSRAHIPIGRMLRYAAIPRNIDANGEVTILLSPSGQHLFHWLDGSTLRFLPGDAGENEAPKSIALREDFPAERVVEALRGIVER